MKKMILDILNKDGSKLEELNVSANIFGRELNSDLVAQYVRVYSTNQRVGNAHTKTRGEVSGAGKKPWKQKGTGRARVGSIRSPLWVKGGITHGPRTKTFRLELPKKMRVGALLNVLSSRFNSDNIKVIDSFDLSDLKTKNFEALIKNLNLDGKKVLVIIENKNENIIKSARNLDRVSVKMLSNLNAYDVLNNSNLLFDKGSVNALERKYEIK
ncbi:MAG: 50S ribosomal protein L4 [Proteobacteria bacterium]|nr:50S ribosomal protein L4 [Pseudomonadota bacterium]